MLPSDKHAPEGDEGVCRTDTSGSVISAESFESAKGAEGAEGAEDAKGPIGLEDLTAAEFESVYVVQAAAENDAHVTGAIEEPPSGIVISYMLHDEIRESELLDDKNLKEVEEVTKTIDEEVADEHVQAITLEEVEQVDKQVIEDKLDKMIELYDNKDLMEAMLEQSLAPEGEDAVPYRALVEYALHASAHHDAIAPLPTGEDAVPYRALDELTVKDPAVGEGLSPVLVAAVYEKYGCLPIATDDLPLHASAHRSACACQVRLPSDRRRRALGDSGASGLVHCIDRHRRLVLHHGPRQRSAPV